MQPYKHPPYLLLVLLFMSGSARGDGGFCPTTECTCDQTEPDKVVILCKDKNFFLVPTFTESNVLFYELTLDNNNLVLIPTEAFANIRVQRLVLTNNPINGIADDAFLGLEDDLEELLLDAKEGGDLELEANLLVRLTRLQSLQLRHFNMPTLPNGLLSNLGELEELTMQSNNLESLSALDLQGVKNSLKMLDVTGNAFTKIPKEALAVLNQPHTLNMALNRITNLVGGSFEGVTTLEHLDLSVNVLEIQESAFSGLEDTLLSIRMHSCQLSNPSMASLQRLSSLQEISLHTNQIDRIPSSAFESMDALTSLDMGGNQLSDLSKAMFTGVTDTLLTLDLSLNSDMRIQQDAFEGFSELTELYLDEADTSGMDADSFVSLVGSLRQLSLKKAGLDNSFWPLVKPLNQLLTLQLSDNRFTLLPEMGFEKFKQLTNLVLDDNQLSEVSQRGTHGLQSSLQALNLYTNNLTTLSSCALNPKDFTSMDIFQLGLNKNPLQCDCHLGWLHDWLKDNQHDIRFKTINWRCAVNDKLFRELDRSELVCDPPEDEPVCEDLVPATTPTPVAPSTTISNEPIAIRVNSTTTSSISVQWEVPSPPIINYFLLEHWIQNSQNQPVEKPVPRDSRSADIHGLRSSTVYQICITMQLTSPSQSQMTTRACTEGRTQEGGDGDGDTVSAQLQVILGAVFGALAFIIIIVVIIICCIRRSQKDVSFDGGELNRIPSKRTPTAGYNSKRFSRQKPRKWQVQNAMNNVSIDQAMQNVCNKDLELQDKIDGFTPEERDRVLQLLRQSGGSTLSVVSAASSHRYVPEPPPCRGAEGYTNAVDDWDENLYEDNRHQYEEIPADTYDQIPCDSYI